MAAGQTGAFSAHSIALVQPSACAGWTQTQASFWGLTSPYTLCSGFSPQCLQQMSPSAFFNMTTSCTSALSASSLSLVSAAQLSQLSALAVGSFTRPTVAGINAAACSGFTPEQVAQIGTTSPYMACAGITAQCASALTVSAVGGFVDVCMALLPVASFAALSSAQITALTTLTAGAITEEQFAGMGSQNSSSCSGFTATQLAQLAINWPDTYDCCQGVVPACMAAFTVDAIAGINPYCLLVVPPLSFKAINTAQLASLTPQAAAKIGRHQLLQLNTQCAGFNLQQLRSLNGLAPYDTCAGFTTACTSLLSPSAVSGLLSYCVSLIPTPVVASLSQAQVSALTYWGMCGITGAQLGALWSEWTTLLPDTMWDLEQANSLTPDTMASFIASVESGAVAQLVGLSPGADLTTVSRLFLANCHSTGSYSCMAVLFAAPGVANTLPSLSWGGMRTSFVQSVGPSSANNGAVFGSLGWLTNPDAWASWPALAVAAITAAQLRTIIPAVFTKFPLYFVSPDVLPLALSTAQMSQVPKNTYLWLSCAQFMSLTSAQHVTLAIMYRDADATLAHQCGVQPVSSTGGGPGPIPAAVSSTGGGPAPTPVASSSSGGGGSDASSSSSSSGGGPEPIQDSSSSSGGATGGHVQPRRPRDNSKGSIIGGVVAGVVVFALVGAFVWCRCKRGGRTGASTQSYTAMV
jgi:hypothetical protein